jgi:tRNA(fMet)-specific endonuclease VapC
MAKQLILVDTSVLIDYFRKQDKERSVFLQLARSGYEMTISSVTEFEIYSGVSVAQESFWTELLDQIHIIPFGSLEARRAVALQKELKRSRKQLDVPDLFFAATALAHELSLASLNRKHFDRVPGLKVV